MKAQEIQPPVIIFPEEISEFRGVNTIKFLWQQAPETAAYHIILAKDRIFKKIAYEDKEVPDPFCRIGPLDYGTYYFKVSSVDSTGKEGAFSPTLSFIIVPPPPLHIPLE